MRKTLALAAATISTLALIGWIFGIDILVSYCTSTPMNPYTAICLMCIAASILHEIKWPLWVALTIASVRQLGYLCGTTIPIDSLMELWQPVTTMAPNTAICLIFLSVVGLMKTDNVLLMIMTIIIPTCALLGRIFGFKQHFDAEDHLMAINTAFAIILLATSNLIHHRECKRK